MAICYDLRFPELFRRYAVQGAKVIVIPAEWPIERIDHWRTLLQARAIENQCYMIATNCAGPSGDKTFGGHSMIVDPWGHVTAKVSDGTGWATARIDPKVTARVRRDMPVLEHRKRV